MSSGNVGRVSSDRPAWIRLEDDPDGTERVWVDAFIREGWVASLRIEEQGGRPVIAEVRIVYPMGKELPRGGLRARVLHDVRLSEPLRLTLGELLTLRGKTTGRPMSDYFPDAIVRAARSDHPAAGKWTDEELALFAADYIRIWRDPESARAPVQALARGWRIKSRHASQLLFKASERGLLVDRVHGKAGGVLSERAQQLLEAASKREKRKRRKR